MLSSWTWMYLPLGCVQGFKITNVKPEAPTINENAVTLTVDWMAGSNEDGPFTVGIWADPGPTLPSPVPPPVATTPLNKEAQPVIVTFTAQDFSQGAYYVSGGEEKDFSVPKALVQAAFPSAINIRLGTGTESTAYDIRSLSEVCILICLITGL
ncbi:hypothetical protein VNI00_017886 [Paramarasmius palmivorus]|uniref:Uncharacterized protein n=1 Tax=Paramarasmius palmivorus TaxID=297713 RepID=A0AAW0B4N1_9AGAR